MFLLGGRGGGSAVDPTIKKKHTYSGKLFDRMCYLALCGVL
jgi:hypothetical protein